MTESPARVDDASSAGIPAELAARLAAVEAHGAHADFDAVSWVWMLLLGLVLPAVLLVVGWWL